MAVHQLNVEFRTRAKVPDYVRERAVVSGRTWKIDKNPDYGIPLPENTHTVIGGSRGIDLGNYPHSSGNPLIYIGTIFHPINGGVKELKLFQVDGLDYEDFPEYGGNIVVTDDFITSNVDMKPVVFDGGYPDLDSLLYCKSESITSDVVNRVHSVQACEDLDEWVFVGQLPDINYCEEMTPPDGYDGTTEDEMVAANPSLLEVIRCEESPFDGDTYTDEELINHISYLQHPEERTYMYNDDITSYSQFYVYVNPAGTEYIMDWHCD